MKGYRKFIIAFCILLALYVIAEMNRPRQLDWTVTLSREDKNPFGSFVLYRLLPGLFHEASIIPTRQPIYNTLQENNTGEKSAYILLEPDLQLSKEDRNAMLKYAADGNLVMLSARSVGKLLADTLKVQIDQSVQIAKDSLSFRLVNPSLTKSFFEQAGPMTIDSRFTQMDTAHSIILGENNLGQPNYISIKFGKGTILIHILPLSFSNIFLLKDRNAEYASAALSYLPADLKTIYWDEYYKLGPEGSGTPLRFILQDRWLKWAYRIGLLAIVSLLLFESKRRQRIIPIVKPLRNATLDFVQTVGQVYYHHRNNKNLALKKITHFTEFVRTKFYLAANSMDEKFVTDLAAKSGRTEAEVSNLVELINYIHEVAVVDEKTLLDLNRQIDLYYERFA